MKSGVSEIIGLAVFGDGAKGTAYGALRPLVCASCGGVIATGEMFTRDRDAGQSFRLWPRCQACVPFALEAGGQTRSALLKALLTPTEQQERAMSEKPERKESAATDERRKADEAMRRRLGPALERAHSSKKVKGKR